MTSRSGLLASLRAERTDGRNPRRPYGRNPRRPLAATFIVSGLVLGGCAAIPADSEGTLDRARNGTLVVGVSEHPPWTSVTNGGVEGTEVDLIRGFADDIDAQIEWHAGPESVLIGSLADGGLDIVIGGLTSDSPWQEEIALTRSYRAVPAEGGHTEDMVMAIRMGENALMVALERYLAEEHGEI